MTKTTIKTIKEKKKQKEKIIVLTAYDYSFAKLLDNLDVDILLVGDSLGMVMLGYDSTIPVTMDDVLHHTKAVTRAAKNSMVIADMPFMSYQTDKITALKNASRFLKEANAGGVKLEGGEEIAETAEFIVKAGIPVMGHLGLTPQRVNQLGGYNVQGKVLEDIEKLISDALILERSGVFAIVLECIPKEVSKIITQKLSIPTIGIGAGNECDGQVLVTHDLLGLFDKFTPKFVKKYANLNDTIKKSINSYIEEVNSKKFPDAEHSFELDKNIANKLKIKYF